MIKGKLAKTPKPHKKFKKLFKTEPISEFHLNHEDEPSSYHAKKCLMDLNRDAINLSSPHYSKSKKMEFDLTLSEWNHQQIDEMRDTESLNSDREEGRAKNGEQFQADQSERNHISEKNKYKFITSRYKFNYSESQRRGSLKGESTDINRSVGHSQPQHQQRYQKQERPATKSIYIRQINLIIKTPTKGTQSPHNNSNEQEKSTQEQKEPAERQKLPKLDRLHGVHAGQYKNKYNFIFRTHKTKKFQLSVHSPLSKQINKINQLIKEQIVNFSKETTAC